MSATYADQQVIEIESVPPQPSTWEEAYLRFETPQQEVRKFQKRLVTLGATKWSRDAQVVELFCGRGNGLRALHNLGFDHVEGIDISPCLASRYRGPGRIMVADCRELPLPDASRDALIVQGGLHHLPSLPEDLEQTLAEAVRVLRPDAHFVAVEPHLTPFLSCVHFVCEQRAARWLSRKVDALATMIENERTTYDRWLQQGELVLATLHKFFDPEVQTVAWGKLNFVGRPKKR
ncbi:MAG TPA: class I SAM-dependent methyltransferase [Candidatus Acidoferrum sp.]|nr:class I SAM-dependent methyltransferase [Candidatus Acidoferrum sp.]